MKLNKIQATADSAVFWCFVVYAMCRIAGAFYTFPHGPSTLMILLAVMLAIVTASLSAANPDWNGRIPKSILLLGFLVLFLFFSTLLQIFLLDEVRDFLGQSSQDSTLSVLFLGLGWMVCGGAVQRVVKSQSLVFSAMLLAFLMTSVLINLRGGLLISYNDLSQDRSDGLQLDHLIVGESATLLLSFSFAFCPIRWRMLQFFASIAILFSLGGRTELFAYCIAVWAFFLLKGSFGRMLTYAAVLGALVVTLGFNYISLDLNNPGIARMLLLNGAGADTSVLDRQRFFEDAVSALPSQMLMGDPAFLIRHFGSMGAYIHNILSAWQFFGFIPFLCFCLSIVWAGHYIWKNHKVLLGPINDFGVLFFIYCVISVLVGKSIGFCSFWFAIGFWLFRMGGQPKPKILPAIAADA